VFFVLPLPICNVTYVTAILMYCQSCIKVHNVPVSSSVCSFILLVLLLFTTCMLLNWLVKVAVLFIGDMELMREQC
jgi:putative effector of murein hydrolase LrgA (UPF0299 family)